MIEKLTISNLFAENCAIYMLGFSAIFTVRGLCSQPSNVLRIYCTPSKPSKRPQIHMRPNFLRPNSSIILLIARLMNWFWWLIIVGQIASICKLDIWTHLFFVSPSHHWICKAAVGHSLVYFQKVGQFCIRTTFHSYSQNIQVQIRKCNCICTGKCCGNLYSLTYSMPNDQWKNRVSIIE